MADDYQIGNGSSNFRLSTDLVDMKSRPAPSVALHGDDQSFTGLLTLENSMEWNQSLLRGEKAENNFISLIGEDMMCSNTTRFQHESGLVSSRLNRGFLLDQDRLHFSQASSNDSTTKFQGIVNSAPVGYVGLLSENWPVISYPYPSTSNALLGSNSHLHFSSNINTPFWNAPVDQPAAALQADARSRFFTADQPSSCFDENLTKKNITEQSTAKKRPMNETPSPLPAFKVRKEKMGDRVTALQQLVSPFGKTDTASVLSEAIEYIKFLHEQVNALSNPYMKNGALIQHQQNYDKSRHDREGHRRDLRSRGLCLVPVSSTYPVTHETTIDFWTPTFGGSFR